MIISVLSGKGGTGKTTVSTNLATYLNSKGYKAQYMDFDVEEPNGFIFIKPNIETQEGVTVKNPYVDEDLCNNCGECARSCSFNAIAALKDKVTVFEKLCHSCGVCSLVCPQNAITEKEREIGFVDVGTKEGLMAIRGILNVGEPMGIPILKKLKGYIKSDYVNIIDSPPGSSCSVINSIEDSDYCILVTEPTVFGLHDLKIAVEVVRKMDIRFGIVINKSNNNDRLVENYCKNENIEILGRLPFDRKIAQSYSKGELLIENDKVTEALDAIISKIMEVIE